MFHSTAGNEFTDELAGPALAEGIVVRWNVSGGQASRCQDFIDLTDSLGIGGLIEVVDAPGDRVRFRLGMKYSQRLAPDWDTLQLAGRAGLETFTRPGDLEREIILDMLAAPCGFEFPGFDELESSIRIRKNIVDAALRSRLSFDAGNAERPEDSWVYDEDRGFTVVPGVAIEVALRKALIPDESGRRYTFSCYRGTEYICLLAIVEELRGCNPALLEKIQRQWETRAVKSVGFHDAFMREYGSMSCPLPAGYFVPGDRIWLRNPDPESSEVAGYEGSWMFYLGGGVFSDFWEPYRPSTLDMKCVEIYCWRKAICRDAAGGLAIDEDRVRELMEATARDPVQMRFVLEQMRRLRDPGGVYAGGGCLDASREYPRLVRPGTCDVALPDF